MNTSQIFGALNFFYDKANPRVRDKILMGSPYAICFAYLCYVLIIVEIFPKFMQDRKPVNYKKFMAFVDAILCARSFYFLTNSSYMWFFLYSWKCQPIDDSGSWLSTYETNISYQFVITKFVYTLQSVVFVMCKRKSPIATYLLIHHTIFPIILWTGLNYYPGGHMTFAGFINSIVHFSVTAMRLMTYFFPNSFIKDYRRSVDVNLHIFQFLIVIWHGSQLFFLNGCDVPLGAGCLEIFSSITIACIYYYYIIHPSKVKSEPVRLDPENVY